MTKSNDHPMSSIVPQTIPGLLARAALLAPDIEAVVAPDGRLTYAGLHEEVQTLVPVLLANGVAKGDRVGLCMGNGCRWLSLFFALGTIGAICVPINTRFKPPELEYALQQSAVKFLFIADKVISTDFAQMLRQIAPGIDDQLPVATMPDLMHVVVAGSDVPGGAQSWQDFLAKAGSHNQQLLDHQPPEKDDVLLIQYTSGTTAFPKGVMLSHASMITNGYIAGMRMGLRPSDRFFSARPFFHVAGTTLSILACVGNLSTLVTLERFTADAALDLMAKESCTQFSGNDTIALMLLRAQEEHPRPLTLRGAWLAASHAVARRVVDELGAKECVLGYGLSEASPNVAQSCYWEPENVRISGAMRPQPGVEVRIIDPQTQEEQPIATRGEICVRGWNVMQGYYGKPKETAAALDDQGWLHTGDLGALDEDGRLWFAGRVKELIRVGGENVSAAEVENLLHRHPHVRQAVVFGLPDPRLVEVTAVFLVPSEGAEIGEKEILEWSRQNMAGFKVPRHIWIVPNFDFAEMTPSAKVKKDKLAAYAIELLARDGGAGAA